MLILSRKTNEQIRIGDQITVTIVRVRGQAVRVGIEAPREMRVLRTELDLRPIPSETPKPQRPSRRREGDCNPGERAFAVGNQPLAAKLHARRTPSDRNATLIG
jgi:carbon storage regulator